MNSDVQRCVDLIKRARHISALTGAGISTSAGIPDFRGPQGLYVTKRYDADIIFDINAFHRDPKPFFEFARDFIALEEQVGPTPAHRFLTFLEHRGKLDGIITQNIDALHQRAGSRNVYELHGGIEQSRCLDCGRGYSYNEVKQKLASEDVPVCKCGGVIKPDIVFFGENVKDLERSAKLIEKSDLLFVIGTSCMVFPAAMLPGLCPGKIIIVNKGDVALSAHNVALTVRQDLDQFFNEVQHVLQDQI